MRFGLLLLITWTIYVTLVEVVCLTQNPNIQAWSDWHFVLLNLHYWYAHVLFILACIPFCYLGFLSYSKMDEYFQRSKSSEFLYKTVLIYLGRVNCNLLRVFGSIGANKSACPWKHCSPKQDFSFTLRTYNPHNHVLLLNVLESPVTCSMCTPFYQRRGKVHSLQSLFPV